MADRKRLTLTTDIAVYFCDPKSPWQHGSNENNKGAAETVLPEGHGLISSHPRACSLGRPQAQWSPQTAERSDACFAATAWASVPRSDKT